MVLSLKQLLESAIQKNCKKRLAIAAAEDVYVLKAIRSIVDLGLIAPIFIGNKKEILKLAKKEKLNIGQDSIIETSTSQESAALAVSLIKEGKADLLMKGLLTTKTLLIEVIHKEKGIADDNLLSHMALFESPYYHKIFGLSDAAMNISPGVNEKISIIRNSVNALLKLGIHKPKVALLAAIERVNPNMQATVDAEKIVNQHQKSSIADCFIEGPLALDIAVSAEAAKHKEVRGEVCGDADLLITPEITSGNVLYKSFTCLGGAKTAGIVLGAKAPIILTSRADTEESKLYSIALALNITP